MACNTASKQVSATGVRAGVTARSSKLTYATGIFAARATHLAAELDRPIERIGQATAPAAQVVLASSTALQANKTAGRVAIGATLAAGLMLPPVRIAHRLVRQIDQVTSLAGDLAGVLSKTESSGEMIQEKRTWFFFKAKTPVPLWRSGLTGLLNRQDTVGASRFTGQNIISSEGMMFRIGNKTWHRGTVVVKTGQGQRTLTHLQSLSLPGTHYYFNQPLSDEQAVGLAAGQLRPETIAGLAGQVSASEALCPGWAELKHSLIKTRLYGALSGSQRQD